MTNSVAIRRFRKNSQFREAWTRLRKNKLAMLGLCVILFILFMSVFAGLFVSYEDQVIKTRLADRLQTPSAKHWFGTDYYGRDLFARILFGGRISFLVGFGAIGFVDDYRKLAHHDSKGMAGKRKLLWQTLIFLGVASLFVFRFFCRYLCPAGAAMAFLARHRLFGRIRPDGCLECGECMVSCPKRTD